MRLFLFFALVDVSCIKHAVIDLPYGVDAEDRDTIIPDEGLRLEEGVVTAHRDNDIDAIAEMLAIYSAIKLILRHYSYFLPHSFGEVNKAVDYTVMRVMCFL